MLSHLVGVARVQLAQRAPYGPLAAVNQEVTHLPAPHCGVQVHVLQPTAHLSDLIPGQLVNNKPTVTGERNAHFTSH